MLRSIILCSVLAVGFTSNAYAQQPAASRPTEVDSAIVAFNAKDYAKAKEWAQKAVRVNDQAREGWEILGFAAQSLDDAPTMIAAGEKLSKLVPGERNGWYLLSIAYFKQSRFDKAVEPMKQLCVVDPSTCKTSGIEKILYALSQDSLGVLDSTFSCLDGKISITLPRTWNSFVRDDGKTLNWFVTLEPMQSDSDVFSVGGSFRWVREITSSFLIEEKNNNATFLVSFWDQFIEAQMKGFTPHMRKIVDSSAITVNGWSGMRRTIDFQFRENTPVQRRTEAILARKGEVFTYTFECTGTNWAVYEPRFKKAISSLQLPQ
ncbi:MAG: hypothetical protein FGM32_01220 [Candidatus Kapabacteria bacterium]|nr:hypothetical protein [Candidatus Kapabacteria bacterium]